MRHWERFLSKYFGFSYLIIISPAFHNCLLRNKTLIKKTHGLYLELMKQRNSLYMPESVRKKGVSFFFLTFKGSNCNCSIIVKFVTAILRIFANVLSMKVGRQVCKK